jgi:DNA-directed RNA polymerase specialized sigma24 family protein
LTTDSPNGPPDAQLGFDKLLSALDPDRDRAGAKYVEAHRRLGYYFQKRGCSVPNDLADETLNRVARKLVVSKETRIIIDHFWYGVARLVLKEFWSHSNREIPDLNELPPALEPSTDPRATEREQDADAQESSKRECMKKCIASLPDDDRDMITRYIATKDKDGLAALLKINVKTMRVNVYRIRRKLNDCLRACLKGIGAGSNSPPRRSSDRAKGISTGSSRDLVRATQE